VQTPSFPESLSSTTRSKPTGSRQKAGRPATPKKPLKPATPAALSFVVTTSATPTETSLEPSLPTIPGRCATAALDRAPQQLQTERQLRQAPDRRVGPSVVASLLVIAALVISQALILRDANQILLHQRDVAPEQAR